MPSLITKRDAKGRILPGGFTGRAKGSKDIVPRRASAVITQESKEAAMEMMKALTHAAKTHTGPILERLAAMALDKENGQAAQAAGTFLRQVLPAAPKHFIHLAPEIADLLPEQRIPVINRMVAVGELDVQSGAALVTAAKVEIESAVIDPIRQALDALDRAVTADETRQAIIRLASTVRRLTGREKEQEVQGEEVQGEEAGNG